VGDSFHSAVIDYFKVSEQQLTDAQNSGILEEELPVVFLIAQRANVGPEAVEALHSSNLNWMQSAFYFHLSPWAFYTPLPPDGAAKTPYEKGYEQYKNRKGRINLNDSDMINFADLKFLSEYYGRDPKEIIQMRAAGKTFLEINEAYWRKKDNIQFDVDMPFGNSSQTPTAQTTPTRRHRHRGMGQPQTTGTN
jgi:hypothetical protein